MAWFTIYDDATGRLVSLATVLAPEGDLTRRGLVAKELAGPPNDAEMWDELTRSYIPRPPKVLVDRVQDLLTDPVYADFQESMAKLLLGDVTKATDDVGELLGGERMRNANEPKVIQAGSRL